MHDLFPICIGVDLHIFTEMQKQMQIHSVQTFVISPSTIGKL